MDQLPNYDGCFVCGETTHSSLTVRFFVDGTEVKGHFTPKDTHQGYKGLCHGGILTSLLEECMGWAPSWDNRHLCVSAEIHIRFVKSVPIGKSITAVGRTTKGTGRLWEAEGEIVDDDGVIYVKGTGKFFPLRKEQLKAVLDSLNYEGGLQTKKEFAS